MPRYHFDEFVLAPRRRLLLRGGTEQPLIPRYFDLLVFLVEHRHEAVHRQDIFDRVWRDVTVSESALSQAIRTIRRVLGDDPKEPRFIRTVSRHGYQFVFPDVIEEADDLAAADVAAAPVTVASGTIIPEPARGVVAAAPAAAPRTSAGAAAEGLAAAAAGGALAGMAAGGVGGLILAAAPGSTAPIAIAPVLAVLAAVAGAAGGAGVGAGIGFAEHAARSHRVPALMSAAAVGGGAVGFAVQWLTRWGLAALIGLDIDIGGGVEGVVIGAFAGLGFAMATEQAGEGCARARDQQRVRAALITAVVCGIAGLVITLAGRPLAGGTIHMIADAAEGSRATLAPLGRLIAEPDFGPVSSAILAFGECAAFGLGVAWALLRRPSLPAVRP